MKIVLGEEQLVYCAPINESTVQWGVYSLPRMWRLPNGNLGIRINGMMDSPDAHENVCPDLYYVSDDDGATWRLSDAYAVDDGACGNVDSPFLRLPNGNIICVREKSNRAQVKDLEFEKEFVSPDHFGKYRTYFQKNATDDTFACELWTYSLEGELLAKEDVTIDFPERELIVQSEMLYGDEYKDIPIYFRSNLCCNPYISSLTLLPDGTLLGTCSGQNPKVTDRYCAEVYLMESKDGGRTWKKRSLITRNSEKYAFGLVGDGGECSLTRAINGDLLLVTRTDMSNDHPKMGGKSDAYLFVSKDDGYTWTEERSVSDSSVTPHVLTFGEDTVVIVYGRPGVHCIVSFDGGKTFGAPISIIGKTLAEELADGKSYMDAKYFDMRSYSNSFVEKISGNSFLIVYNDMKYDVGDGKAHKATLVRKVTIL